MREIEVKARLTNPQETIARLLALGCTLSEPKIQEDVVYAREVGDVAAYLASGVFVRVRIQNGNKVLLTAKKDLNNLVKIEHETVVEDAKEAEAIIRLMGYQEAVRIRKTRRTAQYKGDEICIDEVDGLGTFIEMERLDNEETDAETIQNGLLEFFATLGINPTLRINKGYDILMLEKQALA